MSNCPNCGRPLAEGEVCNCVNNANASAPQGDAYAAPYAAQQNNQYAPPYGAPPQGDPYAPPYAAQQNNPYYQPVPMAAMPARTDYPEGYKPKRKYAACILALLLGPLGIHNFYLGNKNKALAQLLICTVGSLLAGLGMVAAAVWALIDFVELLIDKQDRDADGFKIQTFEEALVAERVRAEAAAQEKEA